MSWYNSRSDDVCALQWSTLLSAATGFQPHPDNETDTSYFIDRMPLRRADDSDGANASQRTEHTDDSRGADDDDNDDNDDDDDDDDDESSGDDEDDKSSDFVPRSSLAKGGACACVCV
jgi:hypothetical protein